MMTQHEQHIDQLVWIKDCPECQKESKAIDWLLAVRKYGLETANEMFKND